MRRLYGQFTYLSVTMSAMPKAAAWRWTVAVLCTNGLRSRPSNTGFRKPHCTNRRGRSALRGDQKHELPPLRAPAFWSVLSAVSSSCPEQNARAASDRLSPQPASPPPAPRQSRQPIKSKMRGSEDMTVSVRRKRGGPPRYVQLKGGFARWAPISCTGRRTE